MGRTACTEPQCLYKGALFLTLAALGDPNVRSLVGIAGSNPAEGIDVRVL